MTRKPHLRAAILSAPLFALLLGGCDTVSGWFGKNDKPPLPGERVAVLMRERKVEADARLADATVNVPPAVANDSWAQAGGNPEHMMGHLALAASPAQAWQVSVGSGSSSSRMLLGVPVVAGGRVYVMDADSHVAAHDARTGGQIWRVDIRPEKERGDASGGGVAFADGRVYASTGYGEVVALDAGNGGAVWRTRVAGPVRGAPTVSGTRVYVLTLDNQTVALNAADGKELWNQAGLHETAGLLGGSSPATDGNLVVPAYSSGEIYGLRPENGRVAWQDSLAAIRRSGALSGLADILGLPVLDRGQVIAVSHSGRMVAIDARMGARVWEAEVGGTQTPYVAGDHVFMVTNDAEVVAVTRRDGRVRWVAPLERYENPKDKTGAVRWAGPVLAGGRLWLTGSNGRMVALAPEDGKEQGRYTLPGVTYLPPVVANNTLYVLTDGGYLVAFR